MFNNYLFDGSRFELPWGAIDAQANHTYTLNLTKGPRRVDEVYGSRSAATSRMYDLCRKYGLNIVKVYNDKHDKTYICDGGAEFHVNRI